MSGRICKQFSKQVADLVGHDLAPEHAARLSDHARRCGRCAKEWRAALERLAAVQTLTPWVLEAAGVRPLSPGSTADAVFARLAAGDGAPRWRFAWAGVRGLRRYAAAAGIVAFLGAGWLAAALLQDAGSGAPERGAADLNVSDTKNIPRGESDLADGERLLTAEETQMILDSASQDLRAFPRPTFVTVPDSAGAPGGYPVPVVVSPPGGTLPGRGLSPGGSVRRY